MVLNVNVKSVILEARELKISDQKTTSKYCFNMVYCIHAADTCRLQANRQMLLLLFIASFVVGAACRILFTRNLMSQICNKQSEIICGQEPVQSLILVLLLNTWALTPDREKEVGVGGVQVLQKRQSSKCNGLFNNKISLLQKQNDEIIFYCT